MANWPKAPGKPYMSLCEACEEKNRRDASFKSKKCIASIFFFRGSTERRAWRPQIVLPKTFHPVFLLQLIMCKLNLSITWRKCRFLSKTSLTFLTFLFLKHSIMAFITAIRANFNYFPISNLPVVDNAIVCQRQGFN